MRRYVYALGRDEYWLKALATLSNDSLQVEPVRCPADLEGCLATLPPPASVDLTLLDATDQPDVGGLVRLLRERGWHNIVVFAADPSWREARAVLRGGASDYRLKSYVAGVIRTDIAQCLDPVGTEQEGVGKQHGPD